MKSRFVFSAFCMLVAMTMATGAFAQATFQVSSSSAQRGRMNGHAEKAGDISLAYVSGNFNPAGASPNTGTVVIDYGVPITNKAGAGPITSNDVTPPDNNISVSICGGDRITDTDIVDVTRNTITITLNAQCDAPGEEINIDNVLLSLVGIGPRQHLGHRDHHR